MKVNNIFLGEIKKFRIILLMINKIQYHQSTLRSFMKKEKYLLRTAILRMELG